MLIPKKASSSFHSLTCIQLCSDHIFSPLFLCSGVFLQGHVGPEAIPELSRVVKSNGGLLCFTVRPTFFEETKETWLTALDENGVDLIETQMLNYCSGLKAPMSLTI